MVKKYSRIMITAIIILMMVAVLAGCGSTATMQRPAMKEGATQVTVTGSCDIKINNGVITVSGETNLLAGSILCVSVEAQNGMTLDSVKITKQDGVDTVSNDFKIPDEKLKNVKAVTGHITCAPRLYGTHAAIVYETYGDKFENIVSEGNVVWDTNGISVVFASDSIDLNK